MEKEWTHGKEGKKVVLYQTRGKLRGGDCGGDLMGYQKAPYNILQFISILQ